MITASRHPVAFVIQSEAKISRTQLRRALQATLERYPANPGSVSILLTDSKEIAGLNHKFRGKNEATDVLTFPSDPSDPASRQRCGDIAISVDHAQMQASARGKSLEDELSRLVIHGALHLAGLDDETEVDRAQMINAMNECAIAIGLPADGSWHTIPGSAF